MTVKLYTSPIALHHILSSENFLHFVPPKDSFNNLLNPKMNNFEAIDYVNKDWTYHHDTLLPRYTQEYPRMSSSFETRMN